jgi:hypothetical protein
MKKNTKLSSAFGYIALTSGSIWLGAYIARLLAAYRMFEITDFTLRSSINIESLPAIFEITSSLLYLTFGSYLLLIASFTLFLVFSKIKLKENGWLLLISLIIFFTFPFESILLITDYKLFILFVNEQFSSEKVLQLSIERLSRLSSFPIVLIFSYLTIPFFLIFKPFTLKEKDED